MWLKNVRYLDYNAGSGLSDLVHQKLVSFLKDEADSGLLLANPSSRHRLGQRVNHFLYNARLSVAHSIGVADSDQILFTSSGSEANQTVIRSAITHAQGAIVGAGEHSSTLDLLPELDALLPFVRLLPLLPNGQNDLSALAILLNEAHSNGLERIFVSLSWANNETGVLLDFENLKQVIKNSPIQILLHIDAAQAWGKMPVEVQATGADYVTFSSHKIGAPAGVGVLWKNPSAPFKSLIKGSQQRGLRGGTENSLGIIALGFASQLLDPIAFQVHTRKLQERLELALKSQSHRIKIWGQECPRISNTTRISFKGFEKYQNWVELLDMRGFAVSHGSACKSEIIEPSRVLLAMGATREEALNSIRISLGTQNTIEDIDLFVDTLLTMNLLKEATL